MSVAAKQKVKVQTSVGSMKTVWKKPPGLLWTQAHVIWTERQSVVRQVHISACCGGKQMCSVYHG